MFTTVSNHGDLVTEKPSPTGTNSELRYFRDAVGGALGSKLRLDMFNDILLNIRAAATAAGITLTDRTYGDENVLRDIIRGLGGLSINNQVTNSYTNTATSGAQPLLLGYDGANQRWVTAGNTSAQSLLLTSTLAFDTDLSAVAANTVVQGEFVGTFNCQLQTISDSGVATAKTNAADADEGKAVYLVIIGTNHHYALFSDIGALQRYRARQVGVVGNVVNGSSVTVAFNTLIQPEKRDNVRRIFAGNAYSGIQLLISGTKFSDYQWINVSGGMDASLGSDTRSTVRVYVPDFVAGAQWGVQESHAADAYWQIRYRNDTSFTVRSHGGNLSAGVLTIEGVK